MIIVLGYVHVPAADVDRFCRDIEALDPSGLAGSGCISYSVTPDGPIKGRLLVAERWRDQQSLTAHLQRTEAIAFAQTWSGRMRSEVLKYDAANERGLMDQPAGLTG
tara:strand:- start:1275 stop:1595 length:321 start_codon:yes stop_codon:yes gene_type:complete